MGNSSSLDCVATDKFERIILCDNRRDNPTAVQHCAFTVRIGLEKAHGRTVFGGKPETSATEYGIQDGNLIKQLADRFVTDLGKSATLETSSWSEVPATAYEEVTVLQHKIAVPVGETVEVLQAVGTCGIHVVRSPVFRIHKVQHCD